MKSIRIGFIGAGLIAHGHAFSLRSVIHGILDKADVTMEKVYDIDVCKAELFAQQHEFRKAVVDPEEILSDPLINVVYICTPTAFHKEYFLRAAKAGKHIFVEKPLAFSLTDIKEMVTARKKAGIQAQVGLVLRHEPIFWYLKKLINEGQNRFGNLLNFTFRSDQEWPLVGSQHDSEWRNNPRLAYGGCLFEHSIHDVDLIRYLFGEVDTLSSFIGHRSSNSNKQIEDSATVNFLLSNGGAGNLTSLYHSIKDRDFRSFEIFFERAAIVIDRYVVVAVQKPRYREFSLEVSGEKVRHFSIDEIENEYCCHIGWPYNTYSKGFFAYQFQSYLFLNALFNGREVFPGLNEGLEAHRIIETVYTNAKKDNAQAG